MLVALIVISAIAGGILFPLVCLLFGPELPLETAKRRRRQAIPAPMPYQEPPPVSRHYDADATADEEEGWG